MSFYKFETDQEFLDEIKGSLGWPVVKVELDESHYKLILKNTKRWFMAKKSLMALVKKQYDSASGCIMFNAIDTVNGVYKVLDVFPDGSKFGGPLGGACDCTYYELLPNGYPLWGGQREFIASSFNGYGSTSYLYQVYQSVEQRKMFYGSGFTWTVQYDHINGHAVYLNPNTESQQVLILYKPQVLPINLLEGRDSQLFFDWGLADAKEKLGRIRSKYKDYPAAGGMLSTDGDTLLQEAKDTKEKLEEEIAGSQGPLMPTVG